MTIVDACESKTNVTPEFPMGWFSVARSHELLVGEVKQVQAFDRELVLYRTRGGVPVLQDAYCPHLGANLGVGGRVVGASATWLGRTLRTWHTEEKNGEVYVWFHPENTAPQWELPELVELGDPKWTEPRYAEFLVPAHVQDIAENSCDPVHFQYVHRQPDVPPSEVTVEENGRILSKKSTIMMGISLFIKLFSTYIFDN